MILGTLGTPITFVYAPANFEHAPPTRALSATTSETPYTMSRTKPWQIGCAGRHLVVSTKHGWMQLNTDNFGLSSRTRNFYYDRNKTTTTISPRRQEGVPHAHRSTIRSATHENHGGRARPPEVGRISQDQMACVNSS